MPEQGITLFLMQETMLKDFFGISVAIDSGLVLTGNSYKDDFTGAVYPFLE